MVSKFRGNNSGYGLPSPLLSLAPNPIPSQRAPTTSDTGYDPGTIWVNMPNDEAYVLIVNAGGVAIWEPIGGGGVSVSTLSGDTGTAIPAAGDILIAGGTNMTTAASGSTVTVNLNNTVQISGDFLSVDANVGGTQSVGVSNTDDTNGASNATFSVSTGGASGGDPVVLFSVIGAQNWVMGIDNSASDAFVVAASSGLGTTNVLSIDTGGTVSVLLGDLTVNRSDAGVNVLSEVTNSDNTDPASNAYFQAAVGGASAGDPAIQFQISGGQNWSVGLDNSASDNFVIAASNALGTTDTLTIDTTGNVTAVLGDLFAARANVGGDVVNSAQNSDNTNAASRAVLSTITGGASGGDPMMQFIVSGVTSWSVGADNSVADDPFTIAASTALGTSNVMTISTVGTMTVQDDLLLTAGSFRTNAATEGISFVVSTGSGAAAGTVNCNGRVGSVTFTGPNIAAAATQSFVVGNTNITGASTTVLYSMRGATTGAAICIQSVTNAANQSTIVVSNGTGATAQTGDLTFDFIVLD